MSRYKTFCAYKGYSNTNCAMHYIHAPDNNMCSWFAVRPKDDGTCVYFVPKIQEK